MNVISVPLILLVVVVISKCQYEELYHKGFYQALDLVAACPLGSPVSKDIQAVGYALLSSNAARIKRAFCKVLLVNRLRCLQDIADDDDSPDQNAAMVSIKLWSAVCDVEEFGADSSCSA